MYQQHWGLSGPPFAGGVDTKRYYDSPSHNEALARLLFLIENGRRVGLLLGPAGSGKTLLLRVLAERVRRQGHCGLFVPLMGVPVDQLLPTIAAQLDPSSPAGDVLRSWRTLTDKLTEHRYQGIQTVILLDDVDQTEPGVPAQLLRLAELDPTSRAPLTLVFAAATQQLGTRLLDLCPMRIELEPWDERDTAEYLSTTLDRAGRRQPAFDAPALARLHQLSGGVPRRLEKLAELSLLAGAAQQLDEVDLETVDAVNEELSVSATS